MDVIWYTAGAAGEPGVYLVSSTDRGASFGPRSLVGPLAKSGTPIFIGAAVAYNSREDRIIVETITPQNEQPGLASAVVLDNAFEPAAANAEGAGIIAYVRKQGNESQIWTSTVGK